MPGEMRTLSNHLHLRRCVVCGSNDPSLDDVRIERCLCCGCDLRERPARTYAEMEGLPESVLPVLTALPPRPERDRGVMQRWLLFLFVMGAAGVLACVLIAEVLSAY